MNEVAIIIIIYFGKIHYSRQSSPCLFFNPRISGMCCTHVIACVMSDFHITRNAFCFSHKFCINYCHLFPSAFENSCKILCGKTKCTADYMKVYEGLFWSKLSSYIFPITEIIKMCLQLFLWYFINNYIYYKLSLCIL